MKIKEKLKFFTDNKKQKMQRTLESNNLFEWLDEWTNEYTKKKQGMDLTDILTYELR